MSPYSRDHRRPRVHKSLRKNHSPTALKFNRERRFTRRYVLKRHLCHTFYRRRQDTRRFRVRLQEYRRLPFSNGRFLNCRVSSSRLKFQLGPQRNLSFYPDHRISKTNLKISIKFNRDCRRKCCDHRNYKSARRIRDTFNQECPSKLQKQVRQ